MELEGTFNKPMLHKLFLRFATQRTPGTLTLTGRKTRAMIHFYNGGITSAVDNRSKFNDRLGNILLELGLLNEKELLEALTKKDSCEKKLGEILIAMDLIRARELRNVLKYQALRVIDFIFGSGKGKFSFHYDPPLKKEKYCFDPIPVKTVLSGRKKILDEWRQLIPIPEIGYSYTAGKSKKN